MKYIWNVKYIRNVWPASPSPPRVAYTVLGMDSRNKLASLEIEAVLAEAAAPLVELRGCCTTRVVAGRPQWWKSRRVVCTRVMPCSLQALITTSSAVEPEGAAMYDTPLWMRREGEEEEAHEKGDGRRTVTQRAIQWTYPSGTTSPAPPSYCC